MFRCEICSLLSQTPVCLFLRAAVGRYQRSAANLHCTLATDIPQMESEEDTRENERDGLGKSFGRNCSLSEQNSMQRPLLSTVVGKFYSLPLPRSVSIYRALRQEQRVKVLDADSCNAVWKQVPTLQTLKLLSLRNVTV